MTRSYSVPTCVPTLFPLVSAVFVACSQCSQLVSCKCLGYMNVGRVGKGRGTNGNSGNKGEQCLPLATRCGWRVCVLPGKRCERVGGGLGFPERYRRRAETVVPLCAHRKFWVSSSQSREGSK
jgi:hypothetical protein